MLALRDRRERAQRELESGVVDLVTTALALPDMDGVELAHHVREYSPQAYIPIIVVSGDVQERLVARSLPHDVTDYFDKSLGFEALAEFIRGYVHPAQVASGEVLYVEDSRVVALATTRMMEKYGLTRDARDQRRGRDRTARSRARTQDARRAPTSC